MAGDLPPSSGSDSSDDDLAAELEAGMEQAAEEGEAPAAAGGGGGGAAGGGSDDQGAQEPAAEFSMEPLVDLLNHAPFGAAELSWRAARAGGEWPDTGRAGDGGRGSHSSSLRLSLSRSGQ